MIKGIPRRPPPFPRSVVSHLVCSVLGLRKPHPELCFWSQTHRGVCLFIIYYHFLFMAVGSHFSASLSSSQIKCIYKTLFNNMGPSLGSLQSDGGRKQENKHITNSELRPKACLCTKEWKCHGVIETNMKHGNRN